MSKKKRDKIPIYLDSDTRVPVRVEDQPTTLGKSIVLGARLMQENDDLQARIAELEADNLDLTSQIKRSAATAADWRQKYTRYGNELEYWKKHRRRLLGRWHLAFKVDVTPWSWYWKPYRFSSSGVRQLAWLCFSVEALEA